MSATFTHQELVKHLVALDVPRDKAERAAAMWAVPENEPTKHRPRVKSGEKAFDFAAARFKMLCKVEGLPMPVTEHYFAKQALGRNWRFDFAWPEEWVALEVQGGIWRKGGGAHQGKGHERDIEKLSAAQRLGWKVMQCVPRNLCTDATITLLRTVLTPPLP